MSACIDVAVGVVYNQQGQVFITRRGVNVHQGGLWEFPGGKKIEGETRVQALIRELHEEIGIRVHLVKPLIQVHHHYAKRQVLLDVWEVRDYSGKAYGAEGQPGKWVNIPSLHDYEFPEANLPIIKALMLSDRYAITPETTQGLTDNIHKLLIQGVRFVQLRLPNASKSNVEAFVKQVRPLFQTYQAKLILNRQVAWVDDLGCDGVHLSSQQLRSLSERPLPSKYWVGASCHDLDELQLAQALSVDFAVLSPVMATKSHPQMTAMGWEQFRSACATVNFPVYALGGMQLEDVKHARKCGGRGIAGIRMFFRQ